MEEIVKHINDTNASYRTPKAGDAKNTDLFLDNEHYNLFKDSGDQIKVRFSKENLSKAVLFIASILPRKYDNSSIHKLISYSPSFVFEQLELLEGYFIENGAPVTHKVQTWYARKDVLKKNGETDNRFYFNGLIEDFTYKNSNGDNVSAKFTIRNYLAGGYSDLHISKSEDGVFDVWITNAIAPTSDTKGFELEDNYKPSSKLSLQQIVYGAPGTGKSYGVDEDVIKYAMHDIRTTFHPDSDYSTFVGAYKPQMEKVTVRDDRGFPVKENGQIVYEKKIVYKYTQQAFLKAYVAAWKDLENPHVLVIEEINRGNCAQIFGDLFQLLDRNDIGFSKYPITADTDIMQVLNEEFDGLQVANVEAINAHYKDDVVSDVLSGSRLLLPNNLYIWATMNTSDQSLFPIDSAFKRRWEWKYVPISNAGKEWKICVNGTEYDWWSFVEKINNKIWDATHSEDKKLGYFFCKADRKVNENDVENSVISADRFVGKVLFYVYNDVFKDYGFDDAIFKDKEDDNSDLSFQCFFKANGKPNEEKIEVFLKNLEVRLASEVVDASVNEEVVPEGSQEESSDVNTLSNDIETEGNDTTKYSFDGKENLGKGQLAVSIIEKYMKEHPNLSYEELKDIFPDSMMGNSLKLIGLIVKEEDVKNAPYSYQKKAYGYFKPERRYKDINGVDFFVSNYWNITNIKNIIDFAKQQGWIIESK
ncbi:MULTISPECIES: AAA family ATPase [unclassified Bacteroides]|uniref:AAA family ATPase n=1 Tax=unclassified Bacteroides TaxID=2646097 RepID=UPI00068A4CC1|nr:MULTISPECIES: AAA family ATPase [unclassified Bacteroides]